MVWLIVGILVIGGVVYYGGRALAGALASRLPYSVDRSIDEMAAGDAASAETKCTNPRLVGALAAKALGLVSLTFGRDQERESDKFGLELMLKAGYAADTFPDFFGRLESHGMPPAWLTTHPASDERAADKRALVSRLGPPTGRAAPIALDDLKAPCK